MRIWEEDKDYEKQIQKKASAGDYIGAAEDERKRNAKIDDLGLDYAKTNRYSAYLPFEEKKFEYSPEKDNSYKAYTKEYTRNMKRAIEDTMGKYAGMTGGIPSTAAMSAATQAGAYEMSKLSDKIPELEQMAYQRWENQRNRDYNNYLDTREFDYRMRNDAYNKGIAERDYQDKMKAQELERAMEYGKISGDFGAMPKEWYTPEAIDNIESWWAENKANEEAEKSKSDHDSMLKTAIGLVEKGAALNSVMAMYPNLTPEEENVLRSLAIERARDLNSSQRPGAKKTGDDLVTTVKPKEPEALVAPQNEVGVDSEEFAKTHYTDDEFDWIRVNGYKFSYEEVEHYLNSGDMVQEADGTIVFANGKTPQSSIYLPNE